MERSRQVFAFKFTILGMRTRVYHACYTLLGNTSRVVGYLQLRYNSSGYVHIGNNT